MKLKKFSLPGFEGVPVYNVFKIVIKELFSPSLTIRSKAIAFSFFLALFPSIIFTFSLIPYIPIDNLSNNIIGYLKNISPDKSIINIFLPVINDIIYKPKIGILSIGFIFIIFVMKNGIETLIVSFNLQIESNVKNKFLLNQYKSIILTLAFLSMFIFTVFFIILGKFIMTAIFHFFNYDSYFLTLLIDFFRISISIALNYFVVSILYYFGPIIRISEKFHTPGAVVSSILFIIITLLFSKYINKFNNFNKLYGSIGTIIFTLVWLQWNSIIYLIGFEINRAIFILKTKKKSKR